MEIHAVDWRAAGLEGFGKPTGYLERQLRRFGGLWELNKTREIPAVERVGAWLAEHLPESGRRRRSCTATTASATRSSPPAAPARLEAVLDWEMATIGDPLADLGYLCMMWTEAGDPEGGLREHLGEVTRAEGFPTRAELIAALRAALRALDAGHALVHDARAVEDGRVHGGQLQARDRRHHR